jgi:hypothetical protein
MILSFRVPPDRYSNVRVGERGRALRLALESLDELVVAGVAGAHHLQSDVPVEDAVVGQEHVGHPPAAKGPDQTVAIVY